jgi:peptidylprolyl isomerase
MKQIMIIGILLLALLVAGCSEGNDSTEIDDEDLQMSVYVDSEIDDDIDDDDIENNGDDSMTIAKFETSMGEFEIELFTSEMPITTGNFIRLAEKGFYDGTRFHRVIENFMIQGGDPLSKEMAKKDYWGTGGPGYSIEDEHVSGAELSNLRGTISMANSGPQSGGSQFFINVVDNTYLDWDKEPSASKHPVFGKVVSGMDVVDAIVNTPVGHGNQPVKDVVVNSVKIESKSR